MKYVYCRESNGFYGYSQLPYDGNIGKYLTIDEASKNYENARKQGSKMFWGNLLPGLLYMLFSSVIVPIVGIFLVIFLIWLTVFLIQRRKKKRAKNSKSDST